MNRDISRPPGLGNGACRGTGEAPAGSPVPVRLSRGAADPGRVGGQGITACIRAASESCASIPSVDWISSTSAASRSSAIPVRMGPPPRATARSLAGGRSRRFRGSVRAKCMSSSISCARRSQVARILAASDRVQPVVMGEDPVDLLDLLEEVGPCPPMRVRTSSTPSASLASGSGSGFGAGALRLKKVFRALEHGLASFSGCFQASTEATARSRGIRAARSGRRGSSTLPPAPTAGSP